MNDPAPYVRDLSWRYPQPIEPLPRPFPWRRMAWAFLVTIATVGGCWCVASL